MSDGRTLIFEDVQFLSAKVSRPVNEEHIFNLTFSSPWQISPEIDSLLP
jgi:hypothetical protein